MSVRKRCQNGSRKARHPRAKGGRKSFSELNAEDLAELTKEFEDEFIVDSFGAPAAPQKAQLRRARRKRGRPKTGKGIKVISLSLERRLLAEADRMAKKLGVPRSQLISRGLRLVLEGHNGPKARHGASLPEPAPSR